MTWLATVAHRRNFPVFKVVVVLTIDSSNSCAIRPQAPPGGSCRPTSRMPWRLLAGDGFRPREAARLPEHRRTCWIRHVVCNLVISIFVGKLRQRKPFLKRSSIMHVDELRKYKDTLDEIKNRIAGETHHVIQALHSDRAATAMPTHLADIATDAVDADLAVLASESAVLSQVQNALNSFHDGSYGTCRQCGMPVDQERLDALPYATLCIRCATMRESPKAQRNRERNQGWAGANILDSTWNGRQHGMPGQEQP